MSIGSTLNRMPNYTGDGATSTYPFTFYIRSAYDLLVTKRDTEGTETTLDYDAGDFTVSGVGESAGGSITLSDALEDGYQLSIRRVREIKQQTDIRNQGDYFPEDIEDEFDNGRMIDLQLQDQLDRCIKQKETEAGDGSLELPLQADRANKFLAFDADGKPIASDGGIDGAIPVSSYIETLLDDATAADARTTLGAASQSDFSAHASRHVSGGADEIAGENLALTLTPTNYTETAATLAGHLAGIDTVLGILAAPGLILPYGGTSAPTGFLICDGTAVSRATYAALYAVIGNAFGEGDGSTTFNLPDLRGRFLRGVDGGAGVDPDAASRTAMATGGNTGDNVGSVQGDALQNHQHLPFESTVQRYVGPFNSPGGGTYFYGLSSGTNNWKVGNPSTGNTSSETRPKNVGVNFIIKT